MKNFVTFFLLFASLSISAQHVSTPEDRAALFDYIIEKTFERESFSPIKEKTLGIDVRANMLKLKDEFIDASSDVELYYAIQKLSAARNDRHLSIDVIEGGLKLPKVEAGTAPIRFHPDFSKKGEYFFFVSDISKDISQYLTSSNPEIGDKLLAINGRPFEDYFENVKAYLRYSHFDNLWQRMAFNISEKNQNLPPSFFKKTLNLLLEGNGGNQYEISLPYLQSVDWKYGRVQKDYPGFELAWQKESFHVYVPVDPKNKMLLLWWYGFRGDLQEAIDQLVDFAEKNKMLDHDLVIDAIDSRGGSQGAYALSRLSPKPFKTTGGNIKLSDITDDFIARYTRRYVSRMNAMDGDSREAEDDGTWVMDWLHGPVLKGLAAGQEYSNNVPFKCAHLPYYSDWMMQPAKKHFTGKMAVMLGPWGGSHLSQFAAMIIDNDLGYTLGMPDGGYSNTWEWHEDLHFPISGKPVVEFMWSIGHTIRPNGQLLEGNPAQLHDFVPVTRDNYLDYKKILLEKALKHLKGGVNRS